MDDEDCGKKFHYFCQPDEYSSARIRSHKLQVRPALKGIYDDPGHCKLDITGLRKTQCAARCVQHGGCVSLWYHQLSQRCLLVLYSDSQLEPAVENDSQWKKYTLV